MRTRFNETPHLRRRPHSANTPTPITPSDAGSGAALICATASQFPATVHDGSLYAAGFPNTRSLAVSFYAFRGPQYAGHV